MNERIDVDISSQLEHFVRLSSLVGCLAKSREESQEPQILIKRKEFLEASPRFTKDQIKEFLLIDEVLLRLASYDGGVSTTEVYELVSTDKKRPIDRSIVWGEIWNLIDFGALGFAPDRKLILSEGVSLSKAH